MSPLNKQVIDIPLYGGLDTKSDDFQVSPGSSLQLKNADLNKTGTVRKRTGYDILSNQKSESSDRTITSLHSLGTWGDQLIAIGIDGYDTANLHDGPKIFTYSTTSEKWQEAGSFTPMEFDVERISSSHDTITWPGVAQGNGYAVFNYRMYTTSGAKFNIHVADSFNTIKHQLSTVGSDYRESRLHYLENAAGTTKKFSALCYDYNSSRIGRWSWNCDTSNINEDSNWQTNMYSDASADDDNLWDACRIEFADGYHHQCLIYKNTSDNIQIRTFDADNTQIWSTELAVEPIYGIGCRFINGDDGVGRLFIMWQQADDFDFYMTVLNENGSELVAATNIDNNLGNGRIGNMTIARDPQWDAAPGNDKSAYTVAYESQDADGDGYLCRTRFIVMADDLTEMGREPGSTVYQEWFSTSVIQAHAYTYGNKAYFPMGHDSTYQATYFIVSLQPNDDETNPFGHINIHGKVLQNIAGPARHENQADESAKDFYAKGLSETIETSTGNYMFAGLRQDRLLSSGDVQYSVQAIKINMAPDPAQIISVSEGAQISGAQIGAFDGQYQQMGFPIYPENIKVNAPDYGSGGEVDTGLHYYKFVYEWFDNKGQIYRSAPSLPVAVDVLGSDDATVQFSVSKFNWSTWATQDLTNLYLYRTTVGGSVYYKSPTGSSGASFGNTQVSISDNSSDADLLDQEQLYTTGGVLENIAPPCSSILAGKNDRLFLVPMDDRKAVWYSKPKVQGVGWEWAAEFVMRLDIDGDNTGLAYMDDKLVIFKERAIYYVFGEGPNSLGQGSFSSPKPITSDVGAVNHNSIVLGPNGLMFKSNKGIYLLDRSLQVSYIGAPVEQYNSYNVVSATLVEDKNNIIFLLSGGQPALVFDYYHNQWSTYFNHAGKDATVFDGKYAFVTTGDRIKHNNPESFTDGNFVIDLNLKTGWIRPKGMQQYMRVYSFSILGHFKSNHTLVVKVYHDYNDTSVAQTFEFDTSTGQSGDEPLQFVGDLSQQKCQSIQFEIYDDDRTDTYESFEITSISMEVAIKNGHYKQPSRKRL